MNDAEKLAEELGKYLPQFNKKKQEQTYNVSFGLLGLLIVAVFLCIVSLILGVAAGFGVVGFRFITHLLG